MNAVTLRHDLTGWLTARALVLASNPGADPRQAARVLLAMAGGNQAALGRALLRIQVRRSDCRSHVAERAAAVLRLALKVTHEADADPVVARDMGGETDAHAREGEPDLASGRP